MGGIRPIGWQRGSDWTQERMEQMHNINEVSYIIGCVMISKLLWIQNWIVFNDLSTASPCYTVEELSKVGLGSLGSSLT